MSGAGSCLYCRKPFALVRPSLSHIIPEALGKGPTLTGSVCNACNHAINSQVENFFIRHFALLRNLLGLEGKGKRGVPSIKGNVTFGDVSIPVSFRRVRDLDDRLFAFYKVRTKPGGKEQIVFIGPPDLLEDAVKKYNVKHPGKDWEKISAEEVRDLPVKVKIDYGVFGTPEALRLASKIALEFWCKKCGPEMLNDNEYDAVRTYARKGKEIGAGLISCVVTDQAILSSLDNIPVGIHSVFLSRDITSPEIIAIVGIFGLIYYKVYLTRSHTIRAKSQELYLINPQTGYEYQPTVYVRRGDVPVHNRSRFDTTDPLQTVRSLADSVMERLNRFLSAPSGKA